MEIAVILLGLLGLFLPSLVLSQEQPRCSSNDDCPGDDLRCALDEESCDPQFGGTICGRCFPTRGNLCPVPGLGNDIVCETDECCARTRFVCTDSQEPFGPGFGPSPEPCTGCGCVALRCGGRNDLQCPPGTDCVDDPNNSGCDRQTETFCTGICVDQRLSMPPPLTGPTTGGGTDCPGVLVPNTNIVCTTNECCARSTFIRV